MYRGLALGHASRHTRTSSEGSAPKTNDPLLASWASQDYRDRRFFQELEEREAKIDSRLPRTFEDNESSDDEENWDEDPELEKLSTAIYRETLANLKSADFYERRTMLQHIESMQKDGLLSKSQTKQFKVELDDAFSAIEKSPLRNKSSTKARTKTTYWTLPESGISGSLRDQLRQRDPNRVKCEQEELTMRAEHSKRMLSLNDQRKWQMIRLAALIKSLRILSSLAAAKAKVRKEIPAPKNSSIPSNTNRSKSVAISSLRTAIPKAKSPTSIANDSSSPPYLASPIHKMQSKSIVPRNSKRESPLSTAGSMAIFSRNSTSHSNPVSKSVQFSRQLSTSNSILPSLPSATVMSIRSSPANDLSPQSSPRANVKSAHKSQSQDSLLNDVASISEINSEANSQSTDADESSQIEQNASISSFDPLDYEILRFETREGWIDQDFETDSHLVDFGSLSVASTNVPYQVLELRKIQSSDDDDFSDDEEEESSERGSETEEKQLGEPRSPNSPKSPLSGTKKISQKSPETSVSKRRPETKKDAKAMQTVERDTGKVRRSSISGQTVVKSALKAIRRDLRKGIDENIPEEENGKRAIAKMKRNSKSGRSDITIVGQQDPFEGAWKIPLGELGENARADRRTQEELKESQVTKAIKNLSLRIEEVEKKRDDLVQKNPKLASTKARHDVEIEAELSDYQARIIERNKIFGKSEDANFENAPETSQQNHVNQTNVVDQPFSSYIGNRSVQSWHKSSLPSLPDPKIDSSNSSILVNENGVPDLNWGKYVAKK